MSTTLLRSPESRVEIAKVLVFMHGSKTRAALHYGLTPGILENILKGRTSAASHREEIGMINADTGTDWAAWEK